MRAHGAAKAYLSADLSSKTLDQKPEELVVLLFYRACTSLKRASLLPMDRVEEIAVLERLPVIEEFHKCTTKAMQIVVALREL